MRVSINLASKPWIELRPLLRKLRIAAAGLLIGMVVLGWAAHWATLRARAAQQNVDKIDAQIAALTREKQQAQAKLRLPQNAEVLERSQFLNQVFAEKSFSWTAVMMDLENVLPSGVQVTNIEPQVLPDGSIVIRLRVNGDRDRSIQLVRNLEQSKRFRGPRLTGESTEAQQGGGIRQVSATAGAVSFDILADYNPLPTPTADEVAKMAKAKADKAGKGGKKAAPATKLKAGKQAAVAAPSPGARPMIPGRPANTSSPTSPTPTSPRPKQLPAPGSRF